MDIDLSQFHQVFFDESLERLNDVEQILIKIDLSQISNESIDAIFRCAHSIKSGSGMFGFSYMSDFTHMMEDYLEKVRNKEVSLTSESIALLLKSVDCLRNMILELQANKVPDLAKIKDLTQKFSLLIEKPNKNLESSAPSLRMLSEKSHESISGWNIYFKPNTKIFQHGDDPLRIFSSLAELGPITCHIDINSFPKAEAFHPDECYLAWNIEILTDKSEQAIREYVFEWIEEGSTIQFVSRETPLESADISDLFGKTKEVSSLRVTTAKVDELINMVGEIVITQSMLTQISNQMQESKLAGLKEGLLQLQHHCNQLQEKVMRIRMLPISNVFNRFPRMIHDLNKTSLKKVELKMTGENTELDKNILEKVVDPLVHLVRNALDHGIELPHERKEKGKNEVGNILLSAFHQGSNIIIQITDDGKGLNKKKILAKAMEKKLITANDNISDENIYDLIFLPGFSTAETVTDLSGRGVGLDVVRKNVESVGGRVTVQSKLGKGTTFVISLPLTLAIIEGQLIRIGQSIYVIPLVSMIETIQIKNKLINHLGNQTAVYYLREKYIPIIRLYALFKESIPENLEGHYLVIVELNNQVYGIVIDELLHLQQIVIKSLENNYGQIEGVSGATVLGDGTVALILDMAGIIRVAEKQLMEKFDINSVQPIIQSAEL